MRGGLDDALDRLARRDELRKRALSSSDGPAAFLPANGSVSSSSSSSSSTSSDGLAEVVEVVRRVVERHPDLAVTVYGQQGRTSAEVRIGHQDGLVRVVVVAAEGPASSLEVPGSLDVPRPAPSPPPAWPLSADGGPGAAARLAELIRQDPSLLAGPDDY